MFAEIYQEAYAKIHDNAFLFNMERLKPSEWAEKNIYLTSAQSNYQGFLKYDLTPYFREIVDFFDRDSPLQQGAIMACSQIGKTATVLVPAICHTIAEDPSNIIFISGTEEIMRNTMRDRLDPVLKNTGLDKLIRPETPKKKNQRSGDTDTKKEFAGGSLTALTYSPKKLRFYTAKKIVADEFDDAPRSDKKEGSIRSLLENRTGSYGESKKILYSSTPTVKGQSNIEEVFLEGDQRKWHWLCPHCNDYIPIEWSVARENGTFGGIKYKLDQDNRLIRDSIYYECQNCGGPLYEKDKYRYNITGSFFPTAIPKNEFCVSWQINSLVLPLGFESWFQLIDRWLMANPPGGITNTDILKSFINTKLGQLWEDKGKELKSNDLMNNERGYQIGLIPDLTAKSDNNGSIVMLALVCDLGGIMDHDNQNFDVRLDWEIIAYTRNLQTYSVDHGSIGTFQRSRSVMREKDSSIERKKYTYAMGQPNNVWDILDTIREKEYLSQSGQGYRITMTIIDTSHFTNYAYSYIKRCRSHFVVGIKGTAEKFTRSEASFNKTNQDKKLFKRSQEVPFLYILEVDKIKDRLSDNMKLIKGVDNTYPDGFMFFPQSESGKYNYKSYFVHFEAEKRLIIEQSGVEVGFKWEKKHSSVENHFFDVRVYSVLAHELLIDIYLKNGQTGYSWAKWCDKIEREDEIISEID